MNEHSPLTEAISVGDLLVRSSTMHPEREALVFPDSRADYGSLRDDAVAAARWLAALGVQRGDRVGILMPNCPEFVHLLFGTALLGAVAVPINARFKRRELAHVLADAGLVTLVTSDIVADHVDFVELITDCLPTLAAAPNPRELRLEEAPSLRSIVLLGTTQCPGMVDRQQAHALVSEIPVSHIEAERLRVRLRDVAMMPYTSGTTAYPKGCLLTHEGLTRLWLAGGRRFGFRENDRFWDPLPMFHLSGIGPLLFAIGLGGTFISMTHFDPTDALAQIREERCTHLFPTFPAVTMALLRHPDYRPEDFESARVAATVAPPETMRLIQGMLPDHVVLTAAYGLTECSGTVVANECDESLTQRSETSGPPIDGMEIRVVDPATNLELPPGTRGEIQVRGFSVQLGYHNDPKKTDESHLPDGWFKTGDLGIVDQAGRVAYVGRVKDMLKVGGENVAPSEIESHLSTHPAVQLAQVVGRADEKYGEIPVAFVELVTGHTVSEEDLIEHCRGQLASFKIPREVRFISEWPMSATKIQKFRLKELLT